ncbi:DUF4129 domain-containing protein [Micromonospora sp. NPDC049559]|uniref:DUF4129 domain-containing protein n=1 Tax=Micromonospora sp. NPDC049559 TaxID=3155923 RepID=UPI00343E1088
MSRFWNEFVADLGDLVIGGVAMLGLLLFLLTALVAVLWYTWPAWLPSRRRARVRRERPARRRRRFRFRWPRLGRLRWRPRWRWRRRPRPEPVPAPELPDDEVPQVPAAVLALSADELAAAGRYAEAVRERLRAVVRDLAERGVLVHRPGWTVTELARMAGRARPSTAEPLGTASEIFSEIWYGLRPATADDDRAMRRQAERVRAALDPEPPRAALGAEQAGGAEQPLVDAP